MDGGIPAGGAVPPNSRSSFLPLDLELHQGWQVLYNVTPVASASAKWDSVAISG